MTITATIRLHEMSPGQLGVINHLFGETSWQLRMREMGILPGTVVKFIRRAPFGGPLQVQLRGYQLFLRRTEASAIALTPA